MQNTRNRQAENDLQNKDVTSVELSTKSMKAVIEEKDAESNDKKFTGKNDEKAAADAINKVEPDLATKEIEQRLKQEIEGQQRNETLSASTLEPETT